MNEIDPYTELAYFYDLLEDPTYEKYIEMLIKALKVRCPNLKNAVVAEIGAGTGLVAYRIYDKVKKLLFIEPSEHMLNAAKAKFVPEKHKNIEFKQTGFPHCGLEKERVDIIISINDPFQYLLTVEMQLKTLEDLYRSLKPGGLILIDNKNFFPSLKIIKHRN